MVPSHVVQGKCEASNTSIQHALSIKHQISYPKGREVGQNEINGLLSFAHIPLNSIKSNHACLPTFFPSLKWALMKSNTTKL